MADKAHIETDKKLIQMERHLSAIYNRARKEIGVAWKDFFTESDAEIKSLEVDYDKAVKSKNQNDIKRAKRELATAKRKKTLGNKHYKGLTEKTAKEITNINKIAAAYINGELPDVYAINYNQAGKLVDGVGGYSFELTDADTVRNLSENTKTADIIPYRKVDTKKDIAWNKKKINSEVLQGILQGESMQDIAARLAKVQDMNANVAIRTARTAVTSAENKGRLDGLERAQKDGIILKKRWIATHDARVRDWHAELDGQTVDIDKPFENGIGKIMFPGDPAADGANIYNCRCTMVGEVLGFKR